MSAGALSAGERSYPISEVRGSGLECQAAMAQEWPRGATLCPRSVVAGRSYLASEVRGGGREELPHIQVQGWPREATLCPRPGAMTLRSHPEPEARAGGQEEQPRSSDYAGAGGPRGAIPH